MEARYRKYVNIPFNHKLSSLSMTLSVLWPEYPLSLSLKTAVVSRVVTQLCADELEEA